MATPYKRRRSASLIRNLWVYRRLVAAAVLMGVMLWFIVINNTQVIVRFPFGLGKMESTSGLAILLGALAGSAITALLMTLFLTMRRLRSSGGRADEADPSAIPEDRPPTDYAAKTTEGFPDADWS